MNVIKIQEYDYHLPEQKIAKYPLSKRDTAKLLIYKNTKISHATFEELTDNLPTNSLIVFNNTKVIRARLFLNKMTGAQIEIFCLEPHSPSIYEEIFRARKTCQWTCIVGNLKKWKNEILVKKIEINNIEFQIRAEKLTHSGENTLIQFNWDADFTFLEILNNVGNIPIPPYLNRKSEVSDLETYQTYYSKIDGSVAAPTAGLHFTKDILAKMETLKIEKQEVTLHVGAGTFMPIKTDIVNQHAMHSEYFYVNKNILQQVIKYQNNITAVGTTTIRTLESIYWIGAKMLTAQNHEDIFYLSQWEAYSLPDKYSISETIGAILNYMSRKNIEEFSARTQIMIIPEYKFKIVSRLITNFHQPKSTLLLLISAFVGGAWKDIYEYALQNNFRFLSYGDSSLLFGAHS